VNNRPHLSSDEKKTCVVLALTLTEYDVNKMAKGYYQALLQSMRLFLSLVFVHLNIHL
jgi:hypothetical protein